MIHNYSSNQNTQPTTQPTTQPIVQPTQPTLTSPAKQPSQPSASLFQQATSVAASTQPEVSSIFKSLTTSSTTTPLFTPANQPANPTQPIQSTKTQTTPLFNNQQPNRLFQSILQQPTQTLKRETTTTPVIPKKIKTVAGTSDVIPTNDQILRNRQQRFQYDFEVNE